MRLPVLAFASRTRLGPLPGLAILVGSALLLSSFVSDAAAHRGDGVRIRIGAGFGHARVYHGSSWSSGPRRYRGLRCSPRVRVIAPIRHYYRPRLYLGLGLGRPYYAPRVLVRDRYIIRDDDDVTRRESAPRRDDDIERGRSTPSEEDFDVTNEPPPGTWYHDRFCDREFRNLDDYTEHLQQRRHTQTIDIIDKRTGDRLHTLEFVNGEWQPQIGE